jgi:succinate dehydrogenase / fumarate reductase cytochrome b subunit
VHTTVKVRPIAPGEVKRHPTWAFATYRTGTWAFLLHRVTGLVILAYLYFHLIVLSADIWPGGRAAFNRVVGAVTSPAFILADLVLILLVLYHALNGIRIMVFDLGYLIDRERALFWALMALGALLMAGASMALLPLARL